MRKLAAAMAICACIALAGCGGSAAQSSSAEVESSASSASMGYAATYDAGTPEGDIEGVISARIIDKMASTDIDGITVNADASSDGKYIALVNLTWNVSNHGDTSKKMLSMYSEDLAATVANECPDVSGVTLFWSVPYLDGTAKVAYESNGGGMMLADEVWDGFDK